MKVRADPKAPIQYDTNTMKSIKMMSLQELRNHISQYNKFYNISGYWKMRRNELVELLEKTIKRFAPLDKDVPTIIPKKLMPKDTSKITNKGKKQNQKKEIATQTSTPFKKKVKKTEIATQTSTPFKKKVKKTEIATQK